MRFLRRALVTLFPTARYAPAARVVGAWSPYPDISNSGSVVYQTVGGGCWTRFRDLVRWAGSTMRREIQVTARILSGVVE